jgi:hypothetical protein
MRIRNWRNGWLTPPGGALNARNIRYLRPEITCNSSISGNLVFYIKIIKPNGDIASNSSSPVGYSYSSSVQVFRNNEQKIELSGYGSADKSDFRAGVWTVEIWYEGACLRSEKIKIN